MDDLLERLPAEVPHPLKVLVCREAIEAARARIQASPEPDPAVADAAAILEAARRRLARRLRSSLRPVVNATGVVIHTNLGRSLLAPEVLPGLEAVAARYSNLEYNLESGRRGSRYSHVEEILLELTGAEAALVVNNNAAAVLITLETLAKGREVIVSRGELVEIGGSFRIPDVMARSGAILREVGATNRTHLRDYEGAIGEATALLLKVHQSNFQVVGFTASVPVADLKVLANRHGLPVVEDLGSGTLVDFAPYGLVHEPTVQESLAAGADLVTFSGDKLLGGPQAGIILGRRDLVDRIRANPLNRALRIDKLTLAALEGTLRLYRDPAEAARRLPTLRMLTAPAAGLKTRARRLARRLRALELPGLEVRVVETVARVGGGALPLQVLPSAAAALVPAEAGISIARLEAALRRHDPPVVARIEDDRLLFDVRTLLPGDEARIAEALAAAVAGGRPSP